ncbi:glycosyltransferase [Nibribacter ruber]|uniref:Glycosyltransferase n=1 Tax=Nibribacter ruber TaxID=2698458 RepID=A0A6P1P431_9BACT|nr:glycosyltransferase family A protein [Nibribacter ruber]QHL89096.1 glycosyltransferase [Nibribacter ruber]
MKASTSYHIHHLNLSHGLPLPDLLDMEQGQYLVFWWKSLALGHVFLESRSGLTLAQLLLKVSAALKPAVEMYVAQSGLPKTSWRLWMEQGKQEKWLPYFQDVFQEAIPQEVPATVPISVVICTCNRAPQLQQCLDRLLQLTCLPEEIIVVDNAPKDNASQEVVEQYPSVRYVRESRMGLDVARNTGARQASLPVVAYVDDDVTVHPVWAYYVWESFQNPDVAALTGLVLASHLKSEAQCIFEKHWSFNRGFVEKVYDTYYFKSTLPKGPPVWEIGAGANMAFRREVFQEVGYFDELLDAGAAGCNGDSEMWYRLLAKGFTILYNPKAIVFHEHRENVQELKRQIFFYMRGHAVAALKQHRYHKAGYPQYLTKLLLVSYSRLAIRGFPHYSFQYQTLWAQVTGLLSGLAFYLKHTRHWNQKP